MLDGVRIYSSDDVWRQIVADLGATPVAAPDDADVNLDNIDISGPIDVIGLKSRVLDAMDDGRMISEIVGRTVVLPRLQAQIVIALHKSGGMRGDALRRALGYVNESAGHAVDTAIYELRRKFGRDFIQNNNGVYSIGGI